MLSDTDILAITCTVNYVFDNCQTTRGARSWRTEQGVAQINNNDGWREMKAAKTSVTREFIMGIIGRGIAIVLIIGAIYFVFERFQKYSDDIDQIGKKNAEPIFGEDKVRKLREDLEAIDKRLKEPPRKPSCRLRFEWFTRNCLHLGRNRIQTLRLLGFKPKASGNSI